MDRRKEEAENKFLCKVDNKKVKHNKKEIKVKKEESENESLNKALRDNVVKVREHKDELIKIKQLNINPCYFTWLEYEFLHNPKLHLSHI